MEKLIDKSGYILNRINSTNKQKSANNVPFPKNALIELTSNCNHACVFCTNPRMKRKSDKLDLNFFKNFINQAAELGLEEVGFYTTGEPLFRKDIGDFIHEAKKAGIKYIYITTNGSLANIEKMKKLIDLGLSSVKFSINAGTKETYALIHGKDDFEKVVKNLKDLREYVDNNKKEVKLLSSFVVTKQTMHEIDLYKSKIGSLVDDFVLLGVMGQSGQSLKQLSELECEMSPEFPEQGKAKPCDMLWDRIHLTQEGYLNLCCIDYENQLVYSDLNKHTLKDAWNNEIIVKMRERQLSQDLSGTLCQNCLYGTTEEIHPILDVETKNRKENLVEKGNNSVVQRIKKLTEKMKKKL